MNQLAILLAILFFWVHPAYAVSPSTDNDLTIKVGVINHQPPQYILDSGGEPSGFAIDILTEVAQLSNLTLQFTIYDRWDHLLKALEDGKITLIPSAGKTAERESKFLLSEAIEEFDVVTFTNTDQTLFDLDADDSPVILVKNYNISILLKRKYPQARLLIEPSERKAVLGLLTSQCDFIVYNRPNIELVLRSLDLDHRIRASAKPIVEVEHVMLINQERPKLLVKVNEALLRIKSNKGNYQRVYERWYGVDPSFWTIKRTLVSIAVAIALLTAYTVGWRFISLRTANKKMSSLIALLEQKISEIKVLRGFLPICANCKKIRNDEGYWQQVEDYIKKHSEAEFTHSICPLCAEELYPELTTHKKTANTKKTTK